MKAFASWLAPEFRRFVELKRATGAAYQSGEGLLRRFDHFVRTRFPDPPLRRDAIAAFLSSLDRLSDRSRENVVGVVWPALAYAGRHEAAIESLPPRPIAPSNSLRLRQPRILSREEFARILGATHQFRGQFAKATAMTVLALLSVTGMRIGETLALDVGDLDDRDRLLFIRRGKFGKARALPVAASTVAALRRYLEHPLRRMGTASSAPIFLSATRRRLSYRPTAKMFERLCRLAQFSAPRPRLHDLRHSFAVNRVVAWYDDDLDVDRLLPALSTYLGHVSVESTRNYLVANGMLLERASARFARKARLLDEAQP